MNGEPVMQPRCPGCLTERYGATVLAFSHGAPCPQCGHSKVYTNKELYRRALSEARQREARR